MPRAIPTAGVSQFCYRRLCEVGNASQLDLASLSRDPRRPGASTTPPVMGTSARPTRLRRGSSRILSLGGLYPWRLRPIESRNSVAPNEYESGDSCHGRTYTKPNSPICRSVFGVAEIGGAQRPGIWCILIARSGAVLRDAPRQVCGSAHQRLERTSAERRASITLRTH